MPLISLRRRVVDRFSLGLLVTVVNVISVTSVSAVTAQQAIAQELDRAALAGGRPVASQLRHELRAGPASDSVDVASVVARFHAALAVGDSSAALALLADDVVILESGGIETLAEYRNHHLPGDIAFARAIASQPGPARVHVNGDVAWVSATSSTQGEYKGRSINSAGAELVVLSRHAGTWHIRAIHWSSRARRVP
ncbi:MAG: nuclear transport factor 2 family protein [Gemmatimonadaceae bacterium]